METFTLIPETIAPKSAYEVRPRYRDDKHKTFFWRDHEHTPHNKRPHSCVSTARLEVEDRADGYNMDRRPGEPSSRDERMGWTQIRLEETTTINGRAQTRTISVGLGPEARRALLAYLLKGDA